MWHSHCGTASTSSEDKQRQMIVKTLDANRFPNSFPFPTLLNFVFFQNTSNGKIHNCTIEKLSKHFVMSFISKCILKIKVMVTLLNTIIVGKVKMI